MLTKYSIGERIKFSCSDEPNIDVWGTIALDSSGRKFIKTDDGLAYYPDSKDIIKEELQMAETTSKETMRLNINVAQDLIDKVDEYARSMNINRTSAVAVLLSTALNSQKAMNDLGELLKLYKENN